MKSKMRAIIFIVPMLICLSGCVTTGKNVILTSNEQVWVMPKGANFQALAESGKPVQSFTAADDLVVMYKGKLLDLEKAADEKAFTKADTAKNNGIIFGSVMSLITLVVGLFSKGIFDKIFQPKK